MTDYGHDAYRTEDEIQACASQDDRIRVVLEQAVRDSVSCVLAVQLGEPADVVEQWVDTTWNGLRDGLPVAAPECPTLCVDDRLAAVMLLLGDRINAEVDQVMQELEEPTP